MEAMPRRASVRGNVLFNELDGEGVVLDTSSGSYFGLNEVATRIWRLLEADGDVLAALATLEEEYAVPRPTLIEDLRALLEELETAGLVCRHG